MRPVVRVVMAILVMALLSPARALAQASIAGVVRDISGAVLPGVTIEASSPALIEKVRTAVSDGAGQYRIVDLRPGIYAVTFTLTGFNTIKREGVELTGSFIATVDAEMRVGALEETITVTGAAPIVDVQSVRQQQTMDKDLVAAIPSARQFYNLATLVTGMALSNTPTGQDVGGSVGLTQPAAIAHGGKAGDSRLYQDGISVGASGAGVSMYMTNTGHSQEVVFSVSGGMGEAETAGTVINIIPRDGGNRFNGSLFFSGAADSMQGSNITADLRARGLTTANELKKVYDFNPGFGGPLKRDRLWFYGTFRNIHTYNWVANTFHNQFAGDVSRWTYEFDRSQRAYTDNLYRAGTMRLTYQASPQHKFAVYWDEQVRCENCETSGGFGSALGGSAQRTPEATPRGTSSPNRVQQVTWTSPLTSRVLLEAGWGSYWARWGNRERTDGTHDPALISVTEQGGEVPGLIYRAPNQFAHHWSGTTQWRASMAYVTGRQNLKIGYQGGWHPRINHTYANQSLNYRFNNGVPNQLTMFADPLSPKTNLHNTSLYAQDSITWRRLTLQGGVRYDALRTVFPAQGIGPTRLLASRVEFPASTGLDFKDVTPRVGVSYDLRGNGQTAVKFTIGRYAQNVANGPGGGGLYEVNPLNRLAFNTSRAWNDVNGNFVPDCDLLAPGQSGECGPMQNQNYGKAAPFSLTHDPDAISGWGNRPYQWELGASVQHELIPRLGLNVGFYRRTFGNFAVIDNLAVSAADYDRYTIAVPADSRLPGGGGQVVTGFDVNPSKFGQVNNQVRLAKNFGDMIESWNGVDVTVNARLQNGLTLQAGTSTGRTLFDVCDVATQAPEVLLGLALVDTTANANSWTPLEYCRQNTGFLTQVKAVATYTIPRIDLQVSGTFQSIPGPYLAANFNAPNAAVAPSLGRNLAGNAANSTINLAAPGELLGDRINQLDMRFAKLLRFGQTRTLVGIDLYNAMNANPVQQYIQIYGPAYLRPTLMLPARFLKVSAQFDF